MTRDAARCLLAASAHAAHAPLQRAPRTRAPEGVPVGRTRALTRCPMKTTSVVRRADVASADRCHIARTDRHRYPSAPSVARPMSAARPFRSWACRRARASPRRASSAAVAQSTHAFSPAWSSRGRARAALREHLMDESPKKLDPRERSCRPSWRRSCRARPSCRGTRTPARRGQHTFASVERRA